MKKILLAIMAVSAMALSFTSCEKTADVNVYPIAGKTYQATGEEGTVQITFRTNFRALFVVKPAMGSSTVNDSFVWQMDTKTIPGTEQSKKLYINFAPGTVYLPTGADVSGLKAYEGYYDGQKCVLYPTYPDEDQESAVTYYPLLAN